MQKSRDRCTLHKLVPTQKTDIDVDYSLGANLTFDIITCFCRQLKKIESIQNTLLGYHAIEWVLPHLGRQSDDIVREVLAFFVVLLFGANVQTQVR